MTRNKLRQTSKHFSSGYREHGYFSPRHVGFSIYSRRAWRALAEVAAKARRIADLGAGGGTLLSNLARVSKAELTGVDFTRESLGRLTELIPGVKTRLANVVKTGLPSGAFDLVVSTMTIEHVDDGAFARELARLVRPGGHVFVSTVLKKPGAWYFYRNQEGERVLEPSHLREYLSVEAFLSVLRGAGLEAVRVEKARIRFPLIDPLVKRLFRKGPAWWRPLPTSAALEWLRLATRIPIPGYRALEVLAVKTPARASKKKGRN